MRSFGIKGLAMIRARSLRNKDLSIKYLKISSLGATHVKNEELPSSSKCGFTSFAELELGSLVLDSALHHVIYLFEDGHIS